VNAGKEGDLKAKAIRRFGQYTYVALWKFAGSISLFFMSVGQEPPPSEFVESIRKLRFTSDVPRSDVEDYMVDEILEEVTKQDGTIWVSLLDNHMAAIRIILAESPRGDKVLQAVLERLESAKMPG
jgi:hypothetical protein